MKRMALSAALTSAWLLVGCASPAGTVVVVDPHLIVVSDAAAASVQVAAGSLTFALPTDDAVAHAQPGDVLVSSGAAPFLRRVVSLDGNAASLRIQTAPASLGDAVVEGSLTSSTDLTKPTLSGGAFAKQTIVNIDALTFNLDQTELFSDGDVKVIVDKGSILLHPYLDIDLQLHGGAISQFQAVLHGDVTATMGVQVTAGHEFSKGFQRTVWTSPPYAATQFIGPVPVVEVATISLVLSGEAHAGLTGTLDLGGAEADANLMAGARYDGTWHALRGATVDFKTHGPSFDAVAHAGATLQLTARVDVKLYDVAGPYIAVGPYARTELTDDLNNGLSFDGRVGFQGVFGGSVSVLGRTLASFEDTLFDVGRDFDPLALGGPSPSPSPSPSAAPSIPGGCPLGDGLYCGGDGVNGVPDTLYHCAAGQLTVVERCVNGCQWQPNGINDNCKR